ncbi:inactive beta-amylase 9-like [Punica granatum]|uniref:Beta-amylase n=2 Tax=Punica granatum TaxID=22663 RepID=A0A6P8BZE4_PUNGR|nr:inactive beta-amylase 9-like [Punica granatum]XP_031375876.1 inactive beta-amylase 9-like [Punica granatum]
MEISVIGSTQAKFVKADSAYRVLGFCSSRRYDDVLSRNSRVCLGQPSIRLRRLGLRLTVRAVHTEPALPARVSTDRSAASAPSRSRPNNGVRLYVGLPLDAVSEANTVNHAKAISVGLKALKLLGVEGVELPVWWGIAEKEAMGSYNFSGYLNLAEMVQKAGLKLHVSLCFHGLKQPKIPLPEWVTRIGENEPSIYFSDRSGLLYKDCLSLAVDELPVLDGKTPIEVYQDFCQSFKSSFSQFIDSTITGISMSLGPNGELRYPSDHGQSRNLKIPGVGEFQCYDKNMLALLKQHAEASGNPFWGLSGPHDAPSYDQTPSSNGFFKDHGGSWESPYGDFFLNWYSSQLASHGARLLSLASSVFSDADVAVYGKVPLLHPWYRTRARPLELTAGFYNTERRDGYEAIAEMFARNSCKVILPGMDLSDEDLPGEALSSPQSLLRQVRAACRKLGVDVSGQNSSDRRVARGGFEQLKENLSGQEGSVDLFIYERMGAYFFSPEHFPSFTAFVRSIYQPQMDTDDIPDEEVVGAEESVPMASESGVHMQAA